MSVEVQIHTAPQLQGLIKRIEDLGRRLVWKYFYIMLYDLENGHFTT